MSNLMRLTKDELVELARDAGWDGDPETVTKAGLVDVIEPPTEDRPGPTEGAEVDTVIVDVIDVAFQPAPALAPPSPAPESLVVRDSRVVGPSRTRQ